MGVKKGKQHTKEIINELYNQLFQLGIQEGYDRGYDDGYDDGVQKVMNDHAAAISEGLKKRSKLCGKALNGYKK